jgi:TolB-like protein/Tfp pilus assembly protein PilF
VDERSIAVLPFKLLNPVVTGDTGDSYLGVGLADALITRLSNVRRLVVRPTGSVLRSSGAPFDPFVAGRELGVGFVLDGHIRRAGERIRVSVQLLDVRGGATVWARQFDETFADALALEDAISAQAAEAVIPQLTGDERKQLARRGADCPDAYEAYLRGRFHWHSFTEEGFAKAIVCYNRAVACDPNYAHAYAGIADYYQWLGIYGVLPSAECSAAAKVAAQKAVDLDESLAEGWASLSVATLTSDFDWSSAGAHLRRALELNPHLVTAHLWYGFQLAMEGRFDAAIVEARRAVELDPLTLFNHHSLAWCLYQSRRFDESIAQYRRITAADPLYGLPRFALSWALRRVGQVEEALVEAKRAVELMNRDVLSLAALGCAYAAAERVEEARGVLAELREMSAKRFVSRYQLALIHCNLGEREEALAELEQSLAGGEGWLVWLGVEPQFDPLRQEPRYQELLRRTNNPLGA